MLPMGDNPFYVVISPNEPSDTASIIWIVILCVVISLLAGFLGWSIYRWRQTAEETNDKRYIVYNTDDRKHPLNNFVSDSEL
jgi:heme/copper-type cytochrome/quinol oxidase subunit 2